MSPESPPKPLLTESPATPTLVRSMNPSSKSPRRDDTQHPATPPEKKQKLNHFKPCAISSLSNIRASQRLEARPFDVMEQLHTSLGTVQRNLLNEAERIQAENNALREGLAMQTVALAELDSGHRDEIREITRTWESCMEDLEKEKVRRVAEAREEMAEEHAKRVRELEEKLQEERIATRELTNELNGERRRSRKAAASYCEDVERLHGEVGQRDAELAVARSQIPPKPSVDEVAKLREVAREQRQRLADVSKALDEESRKLRAALEKESIKRDKDLTDARSEARRHKDRARNLGDGLAHEQVQSMTAREELSVLRSRCTVAEADASRYADELKALRERHATAETNGTLLITELETLRKAFAEAENKATHSETELAAARSQSLITQVDLQRRRELETSLNDVSAKLAEEQKRSTDAAQAHEALLESTRARCVRAEMKVYKRDRELSTARSGAQVAEEEFAKSQARIAEVEAGAKQATDATDAQEKETHELRTKVDELTDSLKSQQQVTQRAADEARTEVGELERRYASIKQLTIRLEADQRRSRKEATVLEDEIRTLQQRSLDSKALSDRLAAQLETERQQSVSEAQTRKKELGELQQRCLDTEKDIGTEQQRAQDVAQTHQQQVQQLKAHLAEVEEKVAQCEEALFKALCDLSSEKKHAKEETETRTACQKKVELIESDPKFLPGVWDILLAFDEIAQKVGAEVAQNQRRVSY